MTAFKWRPDASWVAPKAAQEGLQGSQDAPKSSLGARLGLLEEFQNDLRRVPGLLKTLSNGSLIVLDASWADPEAPNAQNVHHVAKLKSSFRVLGENA